MRKVKKVTKARYLFIWKDSLGWHFKPYRRRKPDIDKLRDDVYKLANSYKPDGKNYHVALANGFIPYPYEAHVYDRDRKEYFLSWHAAKFQIWP